ncbi:MAG: hypothetical protein A2020_04455 [Lentisphaerae bacterium GWF2_45_14]|nr:MAG: hypothetical protein A2020_04455 [Lentisphaerae bacterium GWF2_45_14]
MSVGLDIAMVAAKSSLITRQKEMAVISQNVAMSNDPNYRRRTTIVDSNVMVLGDSGYFGTGCHVQTILRNYDSALETSLRNATSENSYQETYFDSIRNIEDILAPGGEDQLNNMVQSLAAQAQAIGTSPEELANRVAFIRTAENMADRFNQNYTNLAQLRDNIAGNNAVGTGSISKALSDLKSLLGRVPVLNDRIRSLEEDAFLNQQANDLRDERDKIVSQISEFIDISVQEETDGRYTITCDGNVLIDGVYSPQRGADTLSLVMTNTPPSPYFVPSIVLASDSTVTVNLEGGKIKGSLDARQYITDRMDDLYDYAENFGDSVAYPADFWEENVDYALNDVIRPEPSNGFVYELTAKVGTSGTVQPTWPVAVGDTVVDAEGNTWTCADEFSTFNTAHMAGYDLFGDPGAKVFSTNALQPAGGTILTVSITDPQTIAASAVGDETAAAPENAVQKGNGQNMTALWQTMSDPAATNPNLSGESMMSYSNRMIGDISQDVAIARSQSETTLNIQNMFQNSVLGLSGVNMDEEMTNMLEIQKAYQASAKLIKTLDDMMAMVLNMLS